MELFQLGVKVTGYSNILVASRCDFPDLVSKLIVDRAKALAFSTEVVAFANNLTNCRRAS